MRLIPKAGVEDSQWLAKASLFLQGVIMASWGGGSYGEKNVGFLERFPRLQDKVASQGLRRFGK